MLNTDVWTNYFLKIIAIFQNSNPTIHFYIHSSIYYFWPQELEDAEKIRESVVDCFETACLPHLSDEERKRMLSFVIVGGGPTGVEFAAELYDLVSEDLASLYPSVKDLVTVTVIQSGDHILNTLSGLFLSDRWIQVLFPFFHKLVFPN